MFPVLGSSVSVHAFCWTTEPAAIVTFPDGAKLMLDCSFAMPSVAPFELSLRT